MKALLIALFCISMGIAGEKGNINLANRPIVRNQDGTISTVQTMSFNIDGKEILLPTISESGERLSPEQTVQEYLNTGKHLGIFDTPEQATKTAIKIHKQQEKMFKN